MTINPSPISVSAIDTDDTVGFAPAVAGLVAAAAVGGGLALIVVGIPAAYTVGYAQGQAAAQGGNGSQTSSTPRSK